jgi:hypothetical protein
MIVRQDPLGLLNAKLTLTRRFSDGSSFTTWWLLGCVSQDLPLGLLTLRNTLQVVLRLLSFDETRGFIKLSSFRHPQFVVFHGLLDSTKCSIQHLCCTM